jgi:hypothetical protein
MYGERFRNEVDYVGEFEDGVNKPYGTGADFIEAVRRGGYDWLMIGRGRPPAPTTAETRWAPRAGYTLVARTERLALYRAAREAPSAGG